MVLLTLLLTLLTLHSPLLMLTKNLKIYSFTLKLRNLQNVQFLQFQILLTRMTRLYTDIFLNIPECSCIFLYTNCTYAVHAPYSPIKSEIEFCIIYVFMHVLKQD